MVLSPQDVVAQFHRLVASDGSSLSLINVDGEAAFVQYSRNDDTACESCVLSPEDLKAMLLEAFERNKAGIARIEMV